MVQFYGGRSKRLAIELLNQKLLTEPQLASLLEEHKKQPEVDLAYLASDMKLVTRQALIPILCKFEKLIFVKLGDYTNASFGSYAALIEDFSPIFSKYKAVPLFASDGEIFVAMSYDSDRMEAEEMFRLGLEGVNVQIVVADEADIISAICKKSDSYAEELIAQQKRLEESRSQHDFTKHVESAANDLGLDIDPNTSDAKVTEEKTNASSEEQTTKPSSEQTEAKQTSLTLLTAFGTFVLIVGIFITVSAIFMDTSGSGRVHNIGLQQDRIVQLVLGLFTVLFGGGMIAVDILRKK